jgi:8-oxo-dGTP pyrophosphatase MutT (NUDIX family)
MVSQESEMEQILEPILRRKVMMCILRNGPAGEDILLLYHPDHAEAGIQIPGGTVEPGEDIIGAALREAEEETGLTGLVLDRVLGQTDYDMRPFGKNERHHRTFVLLRCALPTPDRWFHWEEHPFDAPGERIRFELVWTRLDATLPPLVPGYDAFLGMLPTP